jgi:zinc transporter ZupT
VPTWVEAGLRGLLGGGALVIGALVAWFTTVPPRVVASVMAFGSGVLISAVAFDLVEEAAIGAILTMIADTMIPEAFEDTHAWTGLITAVGFLTAFAISLA